MSRPKADVIMVGSWEAFSRVLDPDQARQRLRQQLTIAHQRIGRQFVKVARAEIRAGNYAENSPLTILIKGSSKPLVDRGDLFQSLSFALSGPFELRVGLIKQKAGDDLVNIGAALHEGFTLEAHDRVRAAVFAKVRAASSPERLAKMKGRQKAVMAKAAASMASARPRGGSFSLGASVWRIPARPFIVQPLNDPAFVAFLRQTWAEALELALFPPSARAG